MKNMKEKWQKFWRRDYTYHYVEVCLSAFTSKFLEKERLPSFQSMFFVRVDGSSTIYGSHVEADRFLKKLIKKFTSRADEIIKFKERFFKVAHDYVKAGEKMSKLKPSSLPDKKILLLLQDYYHKQLVFTSYVWIVWNGSEHFSNITTNLITACAHKFDLEKNLSGYLKFVSEPVKKSSILLLNEELDKNKLKNKKNNPDKLYKKYLWLPWGDLHVQLWSKKDFLKYISDYAPSVDFLAARDPRKDWHFSAKENLLIKINREMAYLRDMRDEFRRKAVYRAHFLYQEVARRFSISYDDLMFYTTPEIIALLGGSKKLSVAELNRRRGNAVILKKPNELKILSGKDRDKFIKAVILIDKTEIQELRGTVACMGKVSGSVKIIKLNKELDKIKAGDIMVAVTTHPEYVPKMQLAAAIVTDEGGLTCHAAIVAREMNKPCIVGTKTATQILKDGDLVEVDANKGIIKILK
jgi:phosphohistidine swiveling domain-containing protein